MRPLSPATRVAAARHGGPRLRRRIAFRTHRTVVGEQTLEITYYERPCPGCQLPVQLYAVAPCPDRPLISACGQRLLVWSDMVYHPDIARLARDVYRTIACEGGGTRAATSVGAFGHQLCVSAESAAPGPAPGRRF